MAKLIKGKITELIQDDKNANQGTEAGLRLIDDSIRELGLGRSVLVDKNNRLIAGNKTQAKAIGNGVEDVIYVETTGKELVVVRRTDLSLDDDRGRALALADNRTAEQNLNWNPGNLEIHFEAAVNLGLTELVFDTGYDIVSDEDLAGLFTPREGKARSDDDDDTGGDVPPFSFVLTYTEEDYQKVKDALGKIGGTPEQILFNLLGLSE